MSMFLTVVLIISCIVLIASILLQSGKSNYMSGAIGGGAGEQIFGKHKARGYEAIFDKVTKVGAVVFILSTLALVVFQ